MLTVEERDDELGALVTREEEAEDQDADRDHVDDVQGVGGHR